MYVLMKLEEAIQNICKELVDKRFTSSECECRRICRYSFRTHDKVTCRNVEEMIAENLKLHDKPKLFVNITDYFYRESYNWWCSNIIFCCLPLAVCTAFDALSTRIFGPYYKIEVWIQTV